MPQNSIDLERLFKLRLVVARFGEMDIAQWWNSKKQLASSGPSGSTVLKRGFPRTHFFAQARSVFAVAGQRCKDVFDPPGCVTLWHLPMEIEEEFETRWEHWLDRAKDWEPFFKSLDSIKGPDLITVLKGFELVNEKDVEAYSRLKRSAEGRAVPIPGLFNGTDEEITLLAMGFARGEAGALAVPYARRGDA